MSGAVQEVLSRMKVKELRALAAEQNIDLGGARRKADIVGVLADNQGIEAVLGLPGPEMIPPPPPDWEPPPPPEVFPPFEAVPEPEPPSIDAERLGYSTKAELVAIAEAHGLDASGTWAELKERLLDYAGLGAAPPEAVEIEEPAEVPEPPPMEEADVREALTSMTVKELRKLAADQAIALGRARRKADIVDIISAAPNVMDVIREEVSREESAIGAIEETLGEVRDEVEAAIEEVVYVPPMDDPEADAEIAIGLNVDVDFGSAEDLLDQARMRFEESNFDRAASLAEESMAISSIAMGKFHRSALAYTLAASQRLIEEAARGGHDVEEIAGRMVEAKRRYADGTLTDDLQFLRDLQEATRSLYSREIKRAREEIYAAQDVVADADGLGADVSMANEFMRQARMALDRNDQTEAIQMAGKAKEAAEDARVTRIEEIQKAIPVTMAVIQEARNVGADVTEAERLIKQAEIALEAKDFVLVSELVKRAERNAMEGQHYQIEKAMELRRRQVEKAHAMVESIEPTLIQARRLGIDVSEAEALLAKAREVLQDGDYVNGTMYAKEAREIARRVEPKLEELEFAEGIAKPSKGICRQCRSRELAFYDNGWGKCLKCGRTFQWRREEEPSIWGRLREALKE